jgi:glycosyltransferase involved in cell wall biosynthesis
MYKPTVVVTSPAATRSGYGSRARDVIRALIEIGKYDVHVNLVPWGNTPQNALSMDDPKDKMIIDRINYNINFQPDIHIHIVVPNEFTPAGKFNIGITAGLETTLIPQAWIEGCNRMDLVLASSNFSAQTMLSTEFRNDQTKEVLKITKPVGVLFEGADTDLYKVTNECSVPLAEQMDKIKENFNFLFVGHWLQGGLGRDRKDVGMMIKTFLESYSSKHNVGLILKTSGATPSKLDYEDLMFKVDEIKKIVNNPDPPNIYILHGDLHDYEMNQLYNHPKVSAHITFTHGEGFGRPLLEASLSGKPVIAPGWSGHVDFLDKRYATLLGGGLVDVGEDSLPEAIFLKEMKWFMVNHKQAASTMKNVKRNYRRYKIAARKLAKQNAAKFSFKSMVQYLNTLLDKSLPKFTQTVDVKLPNLKKLPKKLPKLEKA